MFEVESKQVSWETLLTVRDAVNELIFKVARDEQDKKLSVCSNIVKLYKGKESSLEVNTIIKLLFTGWLDHSGEYFYPIPSTKHYSVDSKRSSAGDAALDYIVQQANFTFWEGEQLEIRKAALLFLQTRLTYFLGKLDDQYTLLNYLHPNNVNGRHLC